MNGFTFIIALTAIGGGIAVLIIMTVGFFGLVSNRRNSRTLSEDEGKMLQEIWDGLQKMEDRISNLETILMHREKK